MSLNIIHILPPATACAAPSQTIKQPYEMYLAHTLLHAPAHVLESIRKHNAYKILDNGCYELNSSIGWYELFQLASKIEAQEVILPDVMFDMNATFTQTVHTIEQLHIKYGPHIPFNLMAVPQGVTLEEYSICATAFAQLPEITTLGIPKKFMQRAPEMQLKHPCAMALERALFARDLKTDYPHLNVHLLGLSYGLIELQACKDYVRTCDTNKFVIDAQRKRSMWTPWDSCGYDLDNALTDETLQELRAIDHNIGEYLS